MRKVVVLLVLGIVLVGMTPIAMSEMSENAENNGFGWYDPDDADNPDNGVEEPPYEGGEDDVGDNERERPENGEQLQEDGPQQFGGGETQNEHDG